MLEVAPAMYASNHHYHNMAMFGSQAYERAVAVANGIVDVRPVTAALTRLMDVVAEREDGGIEAPGVASKVAEGGRVAIPRVGS